MNTGGPLSTTADILVNNAQVSLLPLAATTHTLREIIALIDRTAKGIALVVDSDHRLIATITDGDVRRAILGGMLLEQPVTALINMFPARQQPIVAPQSTDPTHLREMMIAAGVAQIPLLDTEGRVVGLSLLRDVIQANMGGLRVAIMAGGRGARLKPLTDTLPKPMLQVGNRPLLDIILRQLRESGISHVYITVNYRKEAIVEYFGDGTEIGIPITYVEESSPLGTAGALASIETSLDPLLVMNGDILTSLDFRELLRFHNQHDADLTVAVRPAEFQLPFGVVDVDGERIRAFQEKPYIQRLVNAGVYVLAPHIVEYIPDGQRFDMTDVIDRALTEGHRVVAFPIYEYWSDVGHMGDYNQAQVDVRDGKVRLA